MSRFGAHAFIWRSEWTPAAARAVIEGAAAARLDFVEIPLLRPAEFDAAATRQLLDANGLAFLRGAAARRDRGVNAR